ncbi:ABC transporter substrate-binding protein [Nocardioides sp. cx-173]|uniref:ABC transporter substrate-binding protein n=1 Tax=Nocardioides sp. cx-173 TaxID=2898796 RepID=UPI001E4C8D80|nr:extracellular solute-binding protein [Nocardioides sp. cx-173]MCD4523469.1 extracellular solute-binding protein [Nocardioides sp. cx-173]UGB42192.1 extracellular solute-binding protein [Nocardioides sp. cx-173]
MRRRTLRTPVAAAALVLAFAGCTGQSVDDGEGEGEGDAKSLDYLIEEPEDPEALDALKKHLADFEEESGIEVNVDTLPFDTMRTVLQTQLRSGDGPDVFNWGSGPGFGGALAEAGLLYDMTDAYEDNSWEVYDFAKERVTVDDKLYGLPGEMETIGVFYNKDLFAELGLEEPQSLADLEAAAKAVKAAGKIPLSVGDKEGWEGGHLLSMALSSAVGSEGVKALIDGETSWDSPEVVEALEVWRDLNESGYLGESPTSVDYDNSLAPFYAGEAAMVPTGSWLVGEIDDNAEFEAGYIPFPAPDGPGIFTGGLGSGPFVSAQATSPDVALELVDFLASPEHGEWTVENLHTIPPMPLETSELEVSPLFAQVLEDTATLSTTGDFGYNIDVLTTDAFNEALYDGVQAVLTGQQSPEEVAADLQEAAQK